MKNWNNIMGRKDCILRPHSHQFAHGKLEIRFNTSSGISGLNEQLLHLT